MEQEPEARPTASLESTPDVFRPYLTEDASRDAGKAAAGLSTGFAGLDALDLRWKPGKLYVAAGRSGEGTTTFLLEALLRHVETRSEPTVGGPAVLVSCEENRFNLFSRFLQRASIHPDSPPGAPPRVIVEEWLRNRGRIASVDARAAEWSEELRQAAERLDAYGRAGLLAVLDGDCEGGDAEQLIGKLHDGQRTRGAPPSLLVVDSCLKLRPPEKLRGGSRREQLEGVVDILRRYGKGEVGGVERTEYALPVLLGAEVDPELTGGETPIQPELHHLGKAGVLASVATAVLTLHRPDKKEGGTLHVKVVKNRDGPVDRTVDLGFYGAWSHVAGGPATATAIGRE